MDNDVFPGDLTGGFMAEEPGLPSPPHSHQVPAALTQDEPRRPRRVALLLVATVPWLVLLVVFVRPAATPPAGAVIPTEVATPSVVPSPTRARTAEVATVHGNTNATPEAAKALAVVVARAHLSTAGPAPQIPGIEPGPAGRYVEHVAVEAVDMPAPGAAVVTVVAVALTATGDRYDGVEVVRLAVPIVFVGDRASPGGQPWTLRPVDLTPTMLTVTPDQRPEFTDAAARALTEAGFSEITDVQVATADGWPVVAEFTGAGIGEAEIRTHVVWLRRHFDGLAVAGIVPQEQS